MIYLVLSAFLLLPSEGEDTLAPYIICLNTACLSMLANCFVYPAIALLRSTCTTIEKHLPSLSHTISHTECSVHPADAGAVIDLRHRPEGR